MKRLSPKEEEIMRMFWSKGPMFVRDLLELYNEPKPHYNTVSTDLKSTRLNSSHAR